MRSFAKKVLPERVYHAVKVLKNGVPAVVPAPPMVEPPAVVVEPEATIAPETVTVLPPGVAPDVPSMISWGEAAYFAECARGPLVPGGSIVDLGCFMGSTAIALAHGVKEAGRRDEVIAYDLFEWAGWMDGVPSYGIYQPGDCFLPEARRYAQEHGGGLVSVHRADLSTFEWDGRPISLLLVDAMKSADLAEQIVRSFYPALLPGAVLLHQDYKHFWTGWIHVVQYRFRDRFRFRGSVPGAGTVAFTVASSISPDEVRTRSDLNSVSDEEIDDAIRYSLDLLPPEEAANVAAAHVMLFHHLGRSEPALARLMKYRTLGLTESGEFPGMIQQFFPGIERSARVA